MDFTVAGRRRWAVGPITALSCARIERSEMQRPEKKDANDAGFAPPRRPGTSGIFCPSARRFAEL